jgi:hypothetical protein
MESQEGGVDEAAKMRGRVKKRPLVGNRGLSSSRYPDTECVFWRIPLGTYVCRREMQPEEVPCMCSAYALACGVDEKLSAA